MKNNFISYFIKTRTTTMSHSIVSHVLGFQQWVLSPQYCVTTHYGKSLMYKLIFIPVVFLKVYFIDYAITVVPFFSPLSPSTLHPALTSILPLSSCPWVVHISSLASPFSILFLTPPAYFVPTSYASYSIQTSSF